VPYGSPILGVKAVPMGIADEKYAARAVKGIVYHGDGDRHLSLSSRGMEIGSKLVIFLLSMEAVL
jgi:hypothetical protein